MENEDCNTSFIHSQSLPANRTKQQASVAASENDHQATNRFHRFRYQFHKPEELDDSAITPSVLGKDFCSRTSSQGIAHVYHAPSGIKKVIWLVLSVAAFGLLIAHVTFLVMRYVRFETTTEVSVVPYKTMEFPAVTICNINGEKVPWFPGASGVPSGREIKLDSRIDYENLEPYQLHNKENLIVKAKFDDKRIGLDEFESFIDPEYGNCVTFNKYDPLRQPRSSRRSLPRYGLDLLLNIETYAYQESLDAAPVHAAVIKLHHPDVDPVPEEGSIMVSPGTLNRISVTKESLTRLGSKYGDCLVKNETNRNYTKYSCENKCLQTAVMNECCCYIHVFGHHPPQDKVWLDCDPKSSCCGMEIDACNDTHTECWNDVWNRYDKGSITCYHCLDPCKEIRFSQSVQSVPWPRADNEEFVVWDMQNTLEDADYFNRSDIIQYTFKPETNDTRLSFNDIKANFVKVQIYFESMTTLTIEERAAYGDFEFVSELGGTFGLWAGWTVMTIMEFFEFMVDLVVFYNLKRR